VQRFYGAIAIFCGWLSLPIGAAAGMIVSQFFGVGRVEGAGAPVDVYGVPGIIVFWVLASATLVAALPLLMATIAPDPQRQLRVTAKVLAAIGLAFLGSELGRAFGLPLLAGAAGLWIGGDLLHEDNLASSSAGASDGSYAGASEPGAAREPAVTSDSAAGPAPEAGLVAAAIQSATGGTLEALSTQPGSSPVIATDGPSPRGRRKTVAAGRVCPWCSSAVPARKLACPSCGATLDASAVDGASLPGLTEVPPGLRRYAEDARSGRRRPNLLKMIFSDTPIPTAIDAPPPSDAAALRPPSAAVRAEMARLDFEIAAGRTPLPPGGAGPAGPPASAPEPAGGEPGAGA